MMDLGYLCTIVFLNIETYIFYTITLQKKFQSDDINKIRLFVYQTFSLYGSKKMRKYWIIRTSHVRQALTSVWRALIQMFISGLPQEFKTQRKPGSHGIYLFFLHKTSIIVQNYTYQTFTEIYNLIFRGSVIRNAARISMILSWGDTYQWPLGSLQNKLSLHLKVHKEYTASEVLWSEFSSQPPPTALPWGKLGPLESPWGKAFETRLGNKLSASK